MTESSAAKHMRVRQMRMARTAFCNAQRFNAHRYLMACTRDGAEKAQRHMEICAFATAMMKGEAIEAGDKPDVLDPLYKRVHYATQEELTSDLDKTIGFEVGMSSHQEFDNLVEKFLARFWEIALRQMNDASESTQIEAENTLQERVRPWGLECFGAHCLYDMDERNKRFLEESLELVQSTGLDRAQAHNLVDYVYDRSIGEPHQEVGGVMITLAALCLAQGLEMYTEGERELTRIWDKIDKIKVKQAAKPADIRGAQPAR